VALAFDVIFHGQLTLNRPTLDHSMQFITRHSLGLLAGSLTDKLHNFRNSPGSYDQKWCRGKATGIPRVTWHVDRGELPPVNVCITRLAYGASVRYSAS
jgi:hypothetical protein